MIGAGVLPYDAAMPVMTTPAHEPTTRHGTPDRHRKTTSRHDRHDPKGPSKPKNERQPISGHHRNPSKKGPSRHKSAPATPDQASLVGGQTPRTPTLGTLPNTRGASR